MRIEDIEKELCDVCQEIGSIAEANAPFTYGLAMLVAENGKPVRDLTIAELLELHKKHHDNYMAVHNALTLKI